jgi:hypothetical protein
MSLYKDAALDRLAEMGNVAQFVAFRPDEKGELRQTTARVLGMPPNARFASAEEAVATLLASSPDRSVNIRTYLPEDPQSGRFLPGFTNGREVLDQARALAARGLHLIINEAVDVRDGGVSGVIHGEVIEFAPDDTPRCVEQPGTAAMPRHLGLSILAKVYGFEPDIPGDPDDRIEFSIHPRRRGWRQTNTLLWEIQSNVAMAESAKPKWPNRFSRHIGDKLFGLLIADAIGAKVPQTTAIPRRVAPFSFGRATGSGETWIRTCPREPQPGLFTTVKGWRDPFQLLSEEDPDCQIASVLAQAGVTAAWSGAAILGGDKKLIIEGKQDEGDMFMLGDALPESLPNTVTYDVGAVHRRLSKILGPVRIEWVHDGVEVWIVQLHLGATETGGLVLVRGSAGEWVHFDAARGLQELRLFLRTVPRHAGLILRGEVGLTSHIADVVRKWNRPARMAPPD